MKHIALLCACMLLCGCLVMANHQEKVEGNYVAPATFDQIEPGKTTAAWVKSTLGEPTEKTKVEGGANEIWKWRYTERKESQGAIFLIFGGNNVKERPQTAFVEIKDGVVVNKWRT
jgi:outer membrane protein assembly factor BamE (lipoprotein component of BamABCDE complex)